MINGDGNSIVLPASNTDLKRLLSLQEILQTAAISIEHEIYLCQISYFGFPLFTLQEFAPTILKCEIMERKVII